MSRNRYDDEDNYSARPRYSRREDDRYETWRMDYERSTDDYGRSREGHGREDFGRSGERGGYRENEGRYGRSYDEGEYAREHERDYERGGGGDGRSFLEEGRDYLRRTFGGGADRERGRRRSGPARSRLRCRDIMTRDVAVATRETTLNEVARMMREEDTGIIPVIERDDAPALTSDTKLEDTPRINSRIHSSGKLVGLITDRDIVVRALADGKDPATTRAEEVMTTDIHSAHPNDRVIEAIRQMGDKQVRRIPVVSENGSLRGIISMADVALETEADRELADALEEISSGASFWNKVFS
jgi:CBS domain-containing protein